MPARTIDTAYVEIVPDISALAQIQRKIDQEWTDITRSSQRMGSRVDDVFDAIARGADTTFRDVERDADRAFDDITRSAVLAGAEVDEAISAGGEGAENAFEELSRVARREMDQIDNKVTATAAATSAKFKTAGLAAGAAFAGIGLAATAGLGAIATFGLSSAAKLEQTQISFNALLGSAEEGQAIFKELQQFAAVTPFEFPEIADAAKRFFAFNQTIGLTDDQVEEFLTTIGDIASVTGSGAEGLNRVAFAFGQIASKGRVSLEELNQIGDSILGFSPLQALADKFGVTTAEAMDMVSSGSIDATTGIAALLEGMKDFPGAAGAMEAQSQTLLGVFSTFKDTIGQALAGAFTPVIPQIKDALTELTPIIGDALSVLAPALGDVLASALPLIGDVLQAIVPIITPILDGIADVLGNLDPVLEPLGDSIGELVDAFMPLVPVISDVINEVGVALVPVLAELTKTIIPIVPPLAELLIALLPLLPVLTQLITLSLRLINPWIRLASSIASFIAVKALTPVIRELGAVFDFVFEKIEPVIEVFDRMDWSNVADSIGGAFADAWHAVADFFGKFDDKWEEAKTTAKRAIDNIANWVIHLPDHLANFASNVAGDIVGFFRNQLNSVIRTINSGISAVDRVLIGVSLPHIPELAHGGIAFGPAIIGEDPSTSPEVALPLGDPHAMAMLVNAIDRAMGPNGGGGGGGDITVIVEIDGQQLQARITKTIDEHDRTLNRRVTGGRR